METKILNFSTPQQFRGDRGTKFPRQKNQEGEWIYDLTQLKQQTFEFFSNLFESVGPRNFQPTLEDYPCLVGEDMNWMLTKPVTLEEVSEAIYQLASTKALGPDGLNG